MRGFTGAVRRWGPVLLGVVGFVTLMGFAALAQVAVTMNTSPQAGDVYFFTATNVGVSAFITTGVQYVITGEKVTVNGESFNFSQCAGQTSCGFYANINLKGAATCSPENTIEVQAFVNPVKTAPVTIPGSASGTQYPDYDLPTVNPAVSSPDPNTGWYNMTSGPPNLTLMGDDVTNSSGWCVSGVSEIHYDIVHEDTHIDDGPQMVSGSSASLSFPQDGVYTITFWAVDAAGNDGRSGGLAVPYSAQGASSSGNSGSPWWQAMVRPGPGGCFGGGGLAVPAQANSGPPATPVPDQFGPGPGVCTLSVDLTPPELQIVNQSPAPNANGWNNTSPVDLTVGCSDNLSSWYVGFGGPGFIVCNQQGLPYNQGDQVTAVINFSAEGQHSQTVTAMDAAGNTTQLPVNVKIDLTPPVITITPGGGTFDSGTTVSWTVLDALSGLASCSTSLGSSACSGSTPLTQNMTLTVNAIDLAGNQASASQKFQLNSPSPLILMIESGKAQVGDELSLAVVLVEAPLGLRQYQLTIGTNQAGLVQFESVDNRVSVEDPLDFSSSVSEHGQSVTFSLVDSLDQLQAGAHQVILATLHLRVLKAGKLDLSPLAFSVLNDQGSKEQIIFLPGQLVIQPRGS